MIPFFKLFYLMTLIKALTNEIKRLLIDSQALDFAIREANY